MRRACRPLTLVLLLAIPVAADERPADTPMPFTPEQGADAVVEAFEAKNEKALKALAEKDEPDPWLVADELCYRGEDEAAEAFAKASPRADVEKLPEYVRSWRGREADRTERELLEAVNADIRASNPQKALARPASPGEACDTVVRVRLRHSRTIALQRVRRSAEAWEAFRVAARAAEALGWLRRAVEAYDQAGRYAYRGSDWAVAHAAWQECLAIQGRRGDRAGAAAALGNIGLVHRALGDYPRALRTYEAALEQKESLGDRAGAARTLGNIGNVHTALGDYAKALSTYGACRELNPS